MIHSFSRYHLKHIHNHILLILFAIFVATVLFGFNSGYAQSVFSQDKQFIISKKELLNPELNTELKGKIPEPDTDGSYVITENLLNLIHELNQTGQAIIAREIFNHLKGTDKSAQYATGKETLSANRSNVPVQRKPVDSQQAYQDSVKELPETKDKKLNEYIRFLKIENEFYLGNYEFVYYGAEQLILENVSESLGQDLIYYYAVSISKTGWPTSLNSGKTEKYIYENDDLKRINNILIYLSVGSFITDNFDDTYFYLEKINPPVSTEQLKLMREGTLKNINASFFERTYDAPQDKNLQAVLAVRYAELLDPREDSRKISALLTAQSAAADNRFVISLINELRTLQRISQNFSTRKIGVLLPFSYKKFADLVADCVSGLMLALNRTDGKFELIMEDTALNPDTTEKAVRKLILEDQVAAIIGPLTKLDSERAAVVADQYKVPIISLSQTSNIGDGHEYFYRMYDNADLDLEALVAYLNDYLNIYNIDVVYNPKKENQKKLSVISNSLASNNGTIRNLYEVEPARKDFRDIFEGITGKDLYGKDKTNNKDSFETQLNTDGAVLMLQPSQFLGMASYFKTYGFKNYKIITTGWFPELIYAKDIHDQLVFPEAFLINSDPELEKFYLEHWKMLGHESNYAKPSAYVYYAYNALKFLTTALSGEVNSHEALNDLLKSKYYIQNTLPEFTYNGKGEINRHVNIYKINDQSRITPVF